MGCSSTSEWEAPQRATEAPKRKNYAADPKYQKFLECGAVGDPNEPKTQFISKD